VSPVGVSGTKGDVGVICEDSLCERKMNAFSDISLIAIRKSKTLKTSPWGTPFCLETGEDVVFCIRTNSFLSLRKL